MKDSTRSTILSTAKKIFAINGYGGFSVRILADESKIGISSIYHFFKDKDEILNTIFNETNTNLGVKRSKLRNNVSASLMLLDRIKFQFENIEDVIFVLKYYLHYRSNFVKLHRGFLPEKAYLHIEEVLEAGVKNHEFNIKEKDIQKESKVIAHAINGFLIEYYPDTSDKSEISEVIKTLHKFLMKSLTRKEVNM